MAVHFFHCTNGTELILDREGRQARSKRQVERLAYAAAVQIMLKDPGAEDWSDWWVSVQNQNGSMVTVVPFPSGLT